MDMLLVQGLINPAVIDIFSGFIEQHNNIDTVSSVQVAVRFAINNEQSRRHKNLTLKEFWELRDLMYTRKGGLYYGAMQLLSYDSGYSQKIHRFADFNAGRYASRNAALQILLAKLLKKKLSLDGDLLNYDTNGEPKLQKSNTGEYLPKDR
ncbi:DUF1615 family protein [Methyloglobulus sp.]|uniref:DUF1615 family protein n=1 Tax=Methyloglobulus sp. TaxID=2518622 RepID=UPI00398A13DE